MRHARPGGGPTSRWLTPLFLVLALGGLAFGAGLFLGLRWRERGEPAPGPLGISPVVAAPSEAAPDGGKPSALPSGSPASQDGEGRSGDARVLSAEPSVSALRPRKVPAGRPMLALIIDDVGWSRAETRKLSEIRLPLTWAIIPWLRDSATSVGMARAAGRPYLIHLPMEAIDEPPGRHRLTIGVSDDEGTIRRHLRAAIEAVPGAVGVNNHRGSRATADRRVMDVVADELAAANLFFVDSRTIPGTVAYDAAVARGVPALMNNIFLDNRADLGAIRSRFRQAEEMARRRGYAVAIGHIRPRTLEFLRELEASPPEGIRLVTVPEMMEALWQQGDEKE